MPKRILLCLGFSLIEVLVTLVIIAVGLLGLAAMQSRAQQTELEAYQRAQAIALMQDMVNRIEANREAAGCYGITADGATDFLGTGATTLPTCSSFGTTESQSTANADVAAWHALLIGATELLNGSSVGAVIGARGCIFANAANDRFTVAVAWQGLSETVTPANGCGQGLYGDEGNRRVVTTTVRIPDLE